MGSRLRESNPDVQSVFLLKRIGATMKQNRKLTKVLLMVYLLALTWIILFKFQMDFPTCGT